MISLTPTVASVRRGNDIVAVASEEVKQGEIVAIKVSITGEPVPVGKSPADHVFSGTINEVSFTEARTERIGKL